jgi:hypothetical protein
MTNIAARLNKSGTFYTRGNSSVVFDEITQSRLSVTPNGVYAGELDEVSGTQNGQAMQQLNTGRLIISGVFDEVSGIS